MTNKQILKKAIDKAIKGGYKYLDAFTKNWWGVSTWEDGSVELEWGDKYSMVDLRMEQIIFSHNFAKAFWGRQEHTIEFDCSDVGDCATCCNEDGNGWDLMTKYCWQHRLQQMVLEKEPLKYLSNFI